MSESMDHAIIYMSYEMAMSDEISRRQFYARAQGILSERDQLRAEVERLERDVATAHANELCAMGYLSEVRAIVGGDDFPDMVERVRALTSNGGQRRARPAGVRTVSNSTQWRVRQPRQGEVAGIEVYAGVKYVCQMSHHPGEQDTAQANARRIVACVNACEGLDTGDLENTGLVSAVGYQLIELAKQRDQLLAALEALFDNYKQLADSGDAGNWKLEEQEVGKQALSAIAAAKGGAV